MAQPSSPDMLRRQIGAELRRLREGSGRAGAEVAASLGWSPSKLSRIETGRIMLRHHDLGQLLDLYGVADVTRRDELAELLHHAGTRAWWDAYHLRDAYREYLGLETVAVALDSYHPQLVPGLLQTAQYARAISRAAQSPAEVAETVIKTRLARQDLLAGERPPRLRVLLDEVVLRRPVGGRAVMRGQVRRLIELNDSPTLDLRILPINVGAHACMTGSFTIVTVDGAAAPGVPEVSVYTEGMTGGIVRSDANQVEIYRHSFELDWRLALAAEPSAALLRDLVDQYQAPDIEDSAGR